jgi:hypothetical protein
MFERSTYGSRDFSDTIEFLEAEDGIGIEQDDEPAVAACEDFSRDMDAGAINNW